MFSFQTFKDKRYWILLFPFIIILVAFSVFASNYFIENPLMGPHIFTLKCNFVLGNISLVEICWR